MKDDAKLGVWPQKENLQWGRSRRRHVGSKNRRSRHAHLRNCIQLNLHIEVSHGCSRRCRDPSRLECNFFLACKSDSERFTISEFSLLLR